MDNSIHSNLNGSVGFSIKILKHQTSNILLLVILKKEKRMSDVEAQDIYPLTVEEYESVEVIAEDVEVE